MSIVLPGSEDTQKYGGQIVNPEGPNQDFFVPGSDVENPFNERHDINATHEAIGELLKDGTPNWVKWPHEYKSMAKESFASHREDSERMAAQYKWADQAVLTDKASRQVNGMTTRDFIERKLRANGIKCALLQSDWVGHGGIPTAALWCVPPTRVDRLRFVGTADIPMMYEWSILNLDQYGIPCGRKSIGWRDLAVALVQKEIITEAQCHKIFGAPPANPISARYYRTLWEKRHGKPYLDEEDRDGFGS